ncbi:surface antigen-like protein [Spirosoma oryzae]|uniref:Surface antigen-like protein n=1 Tax=Spirosoma oryzae TaxID=1469603 RepID=A0A2T0TBR3_9BACT|nr:BamA/TamA family outer membrane protein [Spirosoma oryzae]PRY43102.1 surface antigen-like protein [Spirosoma oryzae]
MWIYQYLTYYRNWLNDRRRAVGRLLPIGAVLLLSACNVGRHLPAGEKLYAGTDININADSTVSADEQTTLKTKLQELARPRPNSQLFGFPYKVALYYLFGEPKKEHGFRAWFRRKFGAEPVLASARAIGANAAVFTGTLKNEGYFEATTSGELKEDGYKARGVYQVNVPQRFLVDSVAITIRQEKDTVRRVMQATAGRTVIKKGDPWRLDAIKIERERISQAVKQRGFYYFQPDYIKVLSLNDTARHRANLYFALDPAMPEAAGVPYSIRNVYIYPNYDLSSARADTNLRKSYQTDEDFVVVDSSRQFNPKLFRDIVAVRPGRRYSSRAQDLTLQRFINVGAFKFVRNRFAPDEQGDSAVLDVHYYLTPYPSKSIRLELDGTSRSNNFNGTQATVSWRNRNALGRAELLTINASAGIEFQVNSGEQGVTNYRFGTDATLTFPRLVSPFRFTYDQRAALPRTNATIGYQLIKRGGLYDLNSSQITFGYAWRRNQKIEHIFQPFNINYISISNVDQAVYDTLISSDVPKIIKQQFLSILRSDQLIFSTLYTFNYNSSPRSNSPNSFLLTANVEPAGNLASLFLRKPLENDPLRNGIFGVPFAQFIRADVNARFYRKMTPKLTWANRLFAGAGFTYGNSQGFQIPFTKQYFVGGINSIRAFRPRALGPGTIPRDTITTSAPFQDGGGDIKLEANTEFRFKFNKYLEGAAFVDAGNIWTYTNIGVYGEGSEFTSDFYKQIAVGAGLGVRLDLSYFLVRLDIATPLRKPYQVEGSNWVFDQINLRSSAWRRQNLVFNIGIGYPF